MPKQSYCPNCNQQLPNRLKLLLQSKPKDFKDKIYPCSYCDNELVDIKKFAWWVLFYLSSLP